MVYVPPKFHIPIRQQSHCSKQAAHPGNQKTFELVSRLLWWPTLWKDVKDFVASCATCASSKSSNSRPCGLLQPLPILSRPWTHLAMDFVVELPLPKGNTVIWVVIDCFIFGHCGFKDEEEKSDKERNEPTVGFQYSEEETNQNRNTAGGFQDYEEDTSQERSATSAGQNENVQSPLKGNCSVSFHNKVHTEVHIESKRKKIEDKHFTTYRYPWDRTSLKSLLIDLKAFEKLDAYAAKVNALWNIDNLVKNLLQDAHTDLEKTRAIWIWICHHIEYDTEGLKNLSQVSCDPNDVLRTRKGVCAGYSSLFERMCRSFQLTRDQPFRLQERVSLEEIMLDKEKSSIAGVQCNSVSGYDKGKGYEIGKKFSGASTHAWNMVYLEESWHLLDSTWGAGTVSYNGPFTFGYNEFYFLTHPALFIEDHFPEENEHQLLEPCVSLEQFEKLNRKCYFYKIGLLSSLPDTVTVETVKGKVTFTLEGRHHFQFLFHLNKTETPGLMQLTEHGMKLDVYPQKTGEQILQIFGKREDSEGSYSWILDYKIICKSVDTNMKIPKCLHNPVGPSWLSEKAGLFQPSHQDPVIYTEDGCCTVSFALKGELDVFATLESDEIKMTSDMEHRHIFQTQRKNNVEFRVRLPTSGTYVLCVNVKNPNADTYTSQCEYVIICTKRTVHWPKFPLTYGTWAKHYELLEPLDGILPENSNISFKLRVPDVTEVSVWKGKDVFPLCLTDQGYWEGICHTGATQELTVSACFKDKPNFYILQYEVGQKK
ncbi:kyphoscoliosis peptidase [Xenopus laevis]|uniref:Kyphoscoliosis peptidase n=1 Tax=Xenopus laevis TaxID=8355 RepID=A0A8J1KQX5_XENLA|nr:kyphoscoliosis peptidase [Xenopus laevis]